MSAGTPNTTEAARVNRAAWDSFRRQRDEGLVGGRRDVAASLLAGTSYLPPCLRELAGDVQGKRLLDLGCGDGAELLEWARLGAEVVGVDNSPRQQAAAERTAATLGITCRLVCADLLSLPEESLRGQFDVVFSSAVTTWIGDLDSWFTGVVAALRPGGIFLLEGGHPLAMFYRARQRGEVDWESYFQEGPFVEQRGAEHRWNPEGTPISTVQWAHTLGSIVTAVARAGLRVTHLVEAPDGAEGYGVPGGPGTFAVRAVKE